jgi:four helix bundle protein
VAITHYRDLKVWQLAIDVVEAAYRLTREFPKGETYGIVQQIRRAAISVPSNVAEGHARSSPKEFLHHISIALGSLAELETQLIVATKLNYFGNQHLDAILQRTDETGKMLRGLQKALLAKTKGNP